MLEEGRYLSWTWLSGWEVGLPTTCYFPMGSQISTLKGGSESVNVGRRVWLPSKHPFPMISRTWTLLMDKVPQHPLCQQGIGNLWGRGKDAGYSPSTCPVTQL